jgi:hypothetical protein
LFETRYWAGHPKVHAFQNNVAWGVNAGRVAQSIVGCGITTSSKDPALIEWWNFTQKLICELISRIEESFQVIR